MRKSHNIQEITRYQLVDLNDIADLIQGSSTLLSDRHTLFISNVKYMQDNSISTKVSQYLSSEILSSCLSEKDKNHAWSLHEIESLLYSSSGAHFDCYFQKWFQKKYQLNIQRSNIEYANAVFVDRHKVNYDKIHFYTPMNHFFEECHPVLQKKLLEIDINTISVQQFIRNGKSQKHILIDGQVIDDRIITFNKEEKEQLIQENIHRKFDDFYKQVIFLYPHEIERKTNEVLIDRFTCNVIYIPNEEKIVYIDDTDFIHFGTSVHSLNYIKQDETIEKVNLQTKYVYTQDFIKGKDANNIIKEIIMSKSFANTKHIISEEDDIVDVVGQNFFNGAKAYIAQHVNIDDEVTLVLDKTNVYDRYAILALHNGKGIGYISSKKNLDVNFYLVQNKELQSHIYELDKDGKSTIKIIIKHVKNARDKESPSIKYEKYIYELPLSVAVGRMTSYLNSFEHMVISQNEKHIQLMFLSGLFRLYQQELQDNERIFQPSIKTALYQIFGLKSIYSFTELIGSNKLSKDETNIFMHSAANENQLSIIWEELVHIAKQNVDFKIEIIIDIYLDYLSNVLDTMIISKKKYWNEYNSLQRQILDIKEDLKKLLLI